MRSFLADVTATSRRTAAVAIAVAVIAAKAVALSSVAAATAIAAEVTVELVDHDGLAAVVDAAKGSRLRALIVDVRMGAADNFGPFGFTTSELRHTAARRWREMVEAIVRGDGDAADRLAQQTHVDSLTAALKVTS